MGKLQPAGHAFSLKTQTLYEVGVEARKTPYARLKHMVFWRKCKKMPPGLSEISQLRSRHVPKIANMGGAEVLGHPLKYNWAMGGVAWRGPAAPRLAS